MQARKTVGWENIPLMSTTVKLWAGQSLREFIPVQDLPMKDLEILNVMT